MAGKATTTDHMPTPPTVENASETASRRHAASESVGSGPAKLSEGEGVTEGSNPAVGASALASGLKPRYPSPPGLAGLMVLAKAESPGKTLTWMPSTFRGRRG